MAVKSSVAKQVVEEALGSDAKFILVELKGGEFVPVYDPDGELLMFMDGKAAAKHAQRHTDQTGNKCQPRPVNDDQWRTREVARLEKGPYIKLPWHDERWWKDLKDIHGDHYPHVAINKGAFIAYTETPEKGAADIQTSVRPGRYLERYFGEKLGQYVVRELCSVLSNKHENNLLLLAETEDEIEEVYLNGPGSCMTKSTESYPTGKIHPVRMYAAGDIQVAYIRRDGRVSARSVVFPKGKTYNNIYGDATRLEPLLKKLGYHYAPPVGARLKRVIHYDKKFGEGKYAFVVPHVDNAPLVVDKGEFLIVGDPKVDADKQRAIQVPGGQGHTEIVGYECTRCGANSMPARAIIGVFVTDKNSRNWCKGCVDEHALTCGLCGYHYSKDQAVPIKNPRKVRGRDFIWDKYIKDYTFRCSQSGDLYWKEDGVIWEDGTMVGTGWVAEQKAKGCSYCGKWSPRGKECKCGAGGHANSQVHMSPITTTSSAWVEYNPYVVPVRR